MEWVLPWHQSLIFPNYPLWCGQNGKKKKKIQREAASHAYTVLPDTIASPFPEKEARRMVGEVGRKDSAACNCPGLFCSSPSHRHHFYSFESCLNYCQPPTNYPSCHHGPELPHWTTSLLFAIDFWRDISLLLLSRALPNVRKLTFNCKVEFWVISANFYTPFKLQDRIFC